MKILSILSRKMKLKQHKQRHPVNDQTQLISKSKTIEDYQQELLIKQGREQFKKLVEKGLQLPIALL